MFPFIMQGDNIIIVVNNKSHTITKSHLKYEALKEAIKTQNWELVQDLIEPKKMVLNYGQGLISFQGDKIFWKDREFSNSLAKRMTQMISEDFPIEPLAAFMENVMLNSSKRAVDELYRFLEHNNLPITPDGCFLAYKKVTEDFKDVYSRTVPNKPASLCTPEELNELPGKYGNVTVFVENDATVVTMDRNEVDDNFNNTCSAGLHFCSIEYLNSFGGDKIIIVKVNPRDVVSFPTDYNNSKGRCCRYDVVGELNVSPSDAFVAPVQEAAEISYAQDDDWYSDDDSSSIDSDDEWEFDDQNIDNHDINSDDNPERTNVVRGGGWNWPFNKPKS